MNIFSDGTVSTASGVTLYSITPTANGKRSRTMSWIIYLIKNNIIKYISGRRKRKNYVARRVHLSSAGGRAAVGGGYTPRESRIADLENLRYLLDDKGWEKKNVTSKVVVVVVISISIKHCIHYYEQHIIYWTCFMVVVVVVGRK